MILDACLDAILLGRSLLHSNRIESLSNYSPGVGVHLHGPLFLLLGGQLVLQELDQRLTRQPFHLIVLRQQDICFLQDDAELDDLVSTAVGNLDVKQLASNHLPQSDALASWSQILYHK